MLRIDKLIRKKEVRKQLENKESWWICQVVGSLECGIDNRDVEKE